MQDFLHFLSQKRLLASTVVTLHVHCCKSNEGKQPNEKVYCVSLEEIKQQLTKVPLASTK